MYTPVVQFQTPTVDVWVHCVSVPVTGIAMFMYRVPMHDTGETERDTVGVEVPTLKALAGSGIIPVCGGATS